MSARKSPKKTLSNPEFGRISQEHAKLDLVNHPPHYTSHPSGVEAITVTRHMNFNLGNAMKYLWRAGLKDPAKTIEDLEKAVFYIEDEIKRLGEQK
jgi:hypothetical protein